MQGESEISLITRMTFEESNSNIYRKEIGPIGMQFEIPMLNVSNLNVKLLKFADPSKAPPKRWVRYVTQASSYVCRT